MKNAMKKIMGLLLVAVLLVSVVPFQALAADDVAPIKLAIKDDSDNVFFEGEKAPSNGKDSVVSDLLDRVWDLNWADKYEVIRIWDGTDKKDLELDSRVPAGHSLTVKVKALTTSEPETPTEPAETEAPTTTPTVAPIKVVVKVGSSDNVVKEFEKVPANGTSAKVGDLLTYGWNKDWDNVYDFDHAWNHTQQKEVTKTDSVNAGDTLYIMLKPSSSNSNSGSGSDSTTNKFPYKVYLHVYLNNNIGEPDRNINITNTLAVDGVVSMSEVKNLIPDYYKAKNSNGIGYDGLYLAKGNWVKDYVTDSNKVEKLTDVDVRTGEEYVHINVMITNATAKTTSTADTSNPKTGDAIFMTITVMGLSAAGLTGLYFYDKKRKVL